MVIIKQQGQCPATEASPLLHLRQYSTYEVENTNSLCPSQGLHVHTHLGTGKNVI